MGTKINLEGKKFGRWTVIKDSGKRDSSGNIMWECRCECGNVSCVKGKSLTSGVSKSCGCLQREIAAETLKKNFEDLTGRKFGELTVLGLDNSYTRKNREYKWICKCSCGKQISVLGGNLRSGNTTRCRKCSYDVIADKNTTLRKHNIRLYGIWSGMKSRCYDENVEHFDRYGGRGIIVCDEWLGDNGFENFHNWAMKNGYKNGLTIDRINVDGNYEPNNCRWATNKEQQNNKRTNVFITVDGVEMTMAQAAEKYGVKYATLRARIKSGYSPDIAVRKGLWERENK